MSEQTKEPTMTGITVEQAREGQVVLYWPSTLGRGYRGVIRGEPFKCGETDVVHLRDMESEYSDAVCSGKTYVHAAALECMALVTDEPTIEDKILIQQMESIRESMIESWVKRNKPSDLSQLDTNLLVGEVMKAEAMLQVTGQYKSECWIVNLCDEIIRRKRELITPPQEGKQTRRDEGHINNSHDGYWY